MWKGTLAPLTCMQLAGCATLFEKMGRAGDLRAGLHLDSETGRPANPQLAIYTPDKVSDGFAWHKLHEGAAMACPSSVFSSPPPPSRYTPSSWTPPSPTRAG